MILKINTEPFDTVSIPSIFLQSVEGLIDFLLRVSTERNFCSCFWDRSSLCIPGILTERQHVSGAPRVLRTPQSSVCFVNMFLFASRGWFPAYLIATIWRLMAVYPRMSTYGPH